LISINVKTIKESQLKGLNPKIELVVFKDPFKDKNVKLEKRRILV